MMIYVDPLRPTLHRRACDRCHQSKLKCLRDDDRQPCRRCTESGIECIFTSGTNDGNTDKRNRPGSGSSGEVKVRNTRGRRGVRRSAAASSTTSTPFPEQDDAPLRPSRLAGSGNLGSLTVDSVLDENVQVTTQNSHISDRGNGSSGPLVKALMTVENTGVCMDVDWTKEVSDSDESTIATSSRPVLLATTISARQSGGQKTESEPAVSTKTPVLVSVVRKLSEINLRFTEILTSIPLSVASHEGDESFADDALLQQLTEMDVALDKTLKFSGSFIGCLTKMSQGLHSIKRNPIIPAPFGGVQSLPPLSRGQVTLSGAPHEPEFTLDASSELLLFSGYLRFLEVFDRLFRNMRLCCSTYRRKGSGDGRGIFPFAMPEFSVGSFSMSSEPEMQAVFLVNALESMLTRTRDLVQEVTGPQDTAGYRGNFDCFGGLSLVIVPDLALKAIATREAIILDLAENIKKEIWSCKRAGRAS